MSDRRCRLVAMAIALHFAATPLLAQDDEPRLPSGVVGAGSALDDTQKGVIDKYLRHWMSEITSGDATAVSTARSKLIEPFGNVAGSEIFKTAYSAQLSSQLRAALRSDEMLVRLNAMIIVGNLNDQNIRDMIRIGLGDKIPAVRYRAALAAGQIGAADEKRAAGEKKLDEKQKRALFEVLHQALRAEKDQYVIEQILLAMNTLISIDEARKQLIKELETRVGMHAADPNLSLKPVLEGNKKLIRQQIAARNEAATRELLPLAAKWFSLSAALLKAGKADPPAETQYRDLVVKADIVMRWCVKLIAPEFVPELPDDDIPELVKDSNWDMLMLRDAEWRTLLEKAPINLDGNQIRARLPK